MGPLLKSYWPFEAWLIYETADNQEVDSLHWTEL